MSMQKLNFRVLSVLLNFLFGGARSESFVGGGGGGSVSTATGSPSSGL
jgi:hypothetical protein